MKTRIKKLFAKILALSLIVGMIPFSALTVFSATDSSGLEYSVVGGEAYITGYSGSSTTVTIPSRLGGYNVVRIEDEAFSECYDLVSVSIPSTVKAIGEKAFVYCYKLKTVTFSQGLETIEKRAFGSCQKLESIQLPQGLKTVGASAFDNCIELKSVYFPKTVSSIGNAVLGGCTALDVISVEAGSTYFSGWGNCLIDLNNKNLLAVAHGFTLPTDGSISTIGSYVGYGFEDITELTIPEGVTSIGGASFFYCTALESITLPKSVTSIELLAFGSCSAATIYGYSDSYAELFALNEGMPFVALDGEIIPEGLVYTIENGEATITDYTGSAMKLAIPETCEGYPVTTIGSRAFANTSGLREITIPDSVTVIGDSAFGNCFDLSVVELGNGVRSIGKGAFSCCTSLGSIAFPPSLETINAYAFEMCDLYNIYIPKNVTYVADDAFYLNFSIRSITVDKDNPNYSSDTSGVLFNKEKTVLIKAPCLLSSSYTIPATVKSVGESAFYSCKYLESITIPASVTSIGGQAFESCDSLSTVYYMGDEAAKEAISKGYGNYDLEDAQWYCNSCIGATEHSYSYSCDPLCDVCGYERQELSHYKKKYNYTLENSASYPFSYDGGVYTSTNKDDDSRSTFTVIATGSVALTIDYCASTETSYDCLSIVHNDSLVAEASGSTSWESITLDLVEGDRVEISYTKDVSVSNGDDEVSFMLYSDHIEVSTDEFFPTCEDPVVCDVCEKVVKEALGHSHDNACDKECNTCGEVRSVPDHIYDNVCDTDCNECGLERTVDHVFDNVCDTACNVCGHERSVDHVYDNSCDEVCNVCAWTRTITHDFVWVIDKESCMHNGAKHEECTVCHKTQNEYTVIEALGGHVYEDGLDTVCENCGYERFLMSIAVTKRPDRVVYSIGDDSFDVTGAVITIYYNDDTAATVDMERTMVTGAVFEAVGKKTLTVNYEGRIATFDVEVIASGELSEGLFWTFNGEGILTISGVGAMPSLGEEIQQRSSAALAEYPWSEYNESIRKVVIAEGVTDVASGAFVECSALEEIVVPESVTFIAEDAFDTNSVTLRGYEGSYAQTYAEENGVSFVLVDERPKGDVDGDGTLSSMDMNIMKRILGSAVTPTADQSEVGDVNGDGEFNAIDSNLLSKIIAGRA